MSEAMTGDRAPEAPRYDREERRLLVLTPGDLRSLVLTPCRLLQDGPQIDPGKLLLNGRSPYLLLAVPFDLGGEFFARPDGTQIELIEKPDDLVRRLGNRRFWVFSSSLLEAEINRPLRDLGHPEIGRRQAIFMDEAARAMGEEARDNWWVLGACGGPALDIRSLLGAPAPLDLAAWAVEVVNFFIAAELRYETYVSMDTSFF